MKIHFVLASAFIALSACGGTGVTNLGGGDSGGGDGGGGGVGGGGGGGGSTGADTCAGAYLCSGEVTAVVYDDGGTPGDDSDDILTITGTPFDENPLAATYVRADPSFDLPGFLTFTNDDPELFNVYIANYGTSSGGEVAAGVIGVEGYQDYGYGGTYLLISGTPSIPTEGLVAFTGQSAGVIAFNGSGQLFQTWGDVTMEVDFTDNRLKGFITNRNWVNPFTGDGGTLTSLVLNDTDISGGSFSGTVNSYDGADVVESGTYTGAFGGTGNAMAGAIESFAANDDVAGAGGFTDPDTAFPSDDGITVRDTSVFIAEQSPHGPTVNPLTP